MTRWEHVLSLVDELGAHIWVCETCEDWPEGAVARAVVEDDGTGHVYLSHHPEYSNITYLLSLHELGHLAHQRGKRQDFTAFRRPVLQDEAQAWRWALARACFDLSPDDWAEILWRLQGYGNDRRYKRDPDFDRLLEEAERQAA